MKNLPKVKIEVSDVNPDWVLNESLDINDRMIGYRIFRTVEAEVLTLHLAKGTMRIRYQRLNGKPETVDVDYQPFIDEFSIVKK